MADRELDKKREEARRAMSNGRNFELDSNSNSNQVSNNLVLNDKILPTKTKDRLVAAQAMVSADQKEKRILAAEELAEKKLQAAKAMEGRERKERRQEEERKRLAEEKRAQEIAIIKEKRLLIEKRLELEKAGQIANQSQEEDGDVYRERVEEAKKTITQIARSNSNLPSFHDLTTDLNKEGDKEKTSQAQVAIKEREKQLQAEKEQLQKNKKSFALSVATWFLVILFITTSLFILYYATGLLRERIVGVIGPKHESLIFAETWEKVNIDSKTPAEIRALFWQAGQKNAIADSLTDVYFTRTNITSNQEEIMPTTDFLAVTNTVFTPNFLHFLQPEFMAAIYTKTFSDKSAVFIFKTRSFEHSFDSLLRDGHNIILNLYGDLFSPDQKAAIENGRFEDVMIENISVRLIRSENGETVILYSFLNRETLVLTESEEAFLKVLDSFQRPSQL